MEAGKKEYPYLLVTPQIPTTAQPELTVKLGARNSIQHSLWVSGTRSLEPSSLPPSVYLSSKLEWELEVGVGPMLSSRDVGILTLKPINCFMRGL